MSVHPLILVLTVVYVLYMLILFGFVIWSALTARPYQFIRRPPEPPDRRTGSS